MLKTTALNSLVFLIDTRHNLCGREEIEEIEEMEEGSTEIGRQKSEKRRMEQARCAPGRRSGRPARSTGVHGRAQEGAIDWPRSTDLSGLLSGWSSQPTPVDRLK